MHIILSRIFYIILKRKLEIFPNNGNDNNYVKLVLKNLDVENDDFMLICIKSILFIKNIYDVTYYIGKKKFFFFYSLSQKLFLYTHTHTYIYIYIYIIIIIIIIIIIKIFKNN